LNSDSLAQIDSACNIQYFIEDIVLRLRETVAGVLLIFLETQSKAAATSQDCSMTSTLYPNGRIRGICFLTWENARRWRSAKESRFHVTWNFPTISKFKSTKPREFSTSWRDLLEIGLSTPAEPSTAPMSGANMSQLSGPLPVSKTPKPWRRCRGEPPNWYPASKIGVTNTS